MTTISLHFSSWLEFVEAANHSPKWKRYAQSHSTRDSEWHGTKTFDQAVDMAIRTGWPEGRKLLNDSYAIIAPRPEPHPSQIYSVAGMYPSTPVYVAGSPECMVDLAYIDHATNPIVRIDYTNGGLSDISPESLMLRGAAVLSLCEQLERRNFSTEICLAVRTNDNSYKGHLFETRVIIKKPGEIIDLDRLAFAMAHPSVHRRLRFSLLEQYPELESSFFSMGRTLQDPPKETTENKNIIYIPGPLAGVRETSASARLAVAIAAKAFLESSGDNQGELVANHEMIW